MVTSKPGLGKGLGDLMNGDQVAGKATPNKIVRPPEFGRGLNTLVTPKTPETAVEKPRPLLPSWFFFSADLLLLAFTVAITFHAPRPFDLGTILFCATSIGLGALLAITGVICSGVRPYHSG